MTVLLTVSSLMQTAVKVGANSRYKQEATVIASSTLDSELATGATTLLGEGGDTSLPSVTSAGQVYLLEMEVAPYDPGNLQCVSPASDTGAMLKVIIWATWTDQAAGSTWWLSGSSTATNQLVEQTSLLAVPAAAINPTLGSILVTIEGAQGQGIAHVAVTATPPVGSPVTVTTTAGGCALFANVVTGTWSITFASLTGYITEQNGSTLPSQPSVSVAAASTSSVSFLPTGSPANAYDQQATVTPVYAVPMADGVHPALPTNISSLPLSFYSANLTVTPYVTTSPGEVFPMPNVPSYYVVAGSCGAESAPGGGSVAGQPVTVAAGGTASPTINLVPVQIFVNQGGSLATPGALVTASVSNAAGNGADANCPSSGATVMPTLSLPGTTTVWSSTVRGRHHGGNFILVSGCTSGCATTTTVTSSVNPSTYGAAVTFTATVICTTGCAGAETPPTGHIQFKDNGVALGGQVAMAGGVATYTTAAPLAVGSHPITAVYTPTSGTWVTSTSASLSQIVTAKTTTVLGASSNPSTFNSSVTFTATVTPTSAAPAVGSVAFEDGATTLATVAVNGSGIATYTTAALAVGSHSMSAVFTATNPNNYATSTGTLTQVVNAPGGTPYTLCGLPYGVWRLNATYLSYSSATEAVQVVVTIGPSGISLNGGATWLAAGSPVTVYVK